MAVNDLVVGFFLIELVALPDVGCMLVMLVARNSMLGSHAKNEEGILHQVVIVEHRGRLIPVGVAVQLRLQKLLLVALLVVSINLVDSRLSFHEVKVRQLQSKIR